MVYEEHRASMKLRAEANADERFVDPGRLERVDEPALETRELRAMLERGEDVVVFDVRPADERAEWFIPGSVHRDVYPALRAGDPRALADLPFGTESPVVVVCALGRTSEAVAARLRELGYRAFTLAGGMKGWSLAWNTAELASPTATLVQVRRTGKGCLSYLVGSGAEAAVVDPSLDPALYLRLADGRGWTVRHVLDTHIHADHLSRAPALAAAAGAELWLPEQKRARFPHRSLREGESLRLGDTTLEAIRTPGHTHESTCYFADGRWLLTGDTLFPRSIGRPDLEARAGEAQARAELLHESLRRLLQLDPGLLVLAGHTSEPIPFDHVIIGRALGEIRSSLPLADDARTFAGEVLRRIPPTPPNHHVIVGWNESGQLPPGDTTDLEAGANRCALTPGTSPSGGFA